MVNKIEAEITAMQADFAHTMAWLRGDYLPSPLPKAVEERRASLAARFDALRDMVEAREGELASFARLLTSVPVQDEDLIERDQTPLPEADL